MSSDIALRIESLFQEFGTMLVGSKAAKTFDIVKNKEGLQLVVQTSRGKTAIVDMTQSSEVFFLTFDDVYKQQAIAYEDDDKIKIVKDYLDAVELFAKNKQHEEVYKKNGRVAARTLYVEGLHPISTASNLRKSLLTIMGYTKHTMP